VENEKNLMPICALIVDDSSVMRKIVERSLRQAGIELTKVIEAGNGTEALSALQENKVDLILCDINMPVMDGLEFVKQLPNVANGKGVPVVMITTEGSEGHVVQALSAGARGYILKRDAGNELVAALEAVQQHKLYFTTKVSEVILHGYLQQGEEKETPGAPLTRLTSREREIIKLVAEGKANKEIAHLLSISIRTVESHRANIMEKLDLHSVTDLVRYAIRNNLLEC